MNTGIIILAAGSASRLGKIKQLLHFNSKTFIQHIIDEAVEANLNPIIVITGANADVVSTQINKEKTQLVFNEHWKRGMASGIVAGVEKVASLKTNIENIFIAVCDQPFISASLFEQMMKEKNSSGKGIIACSYADTIGTPVLFNQKYFGQLLQIKGEEGAKKILKKNHEDVATVSFPQGNIDIDTQSDYDNLLDKQKHVL